MRTASWSSRSVVLLLGVAWLAGCATKHAPRPSASAAPARSGGYYLDDGPGLAPPNLDAIPDAVPRAEPLHRFANRPYSVLGRDYVPATELRPYKERGVASWYGRKFHAQKTSTGEAYDMYAMTAAHPTLPLPSYARVTNLANGKSVVVRVNDRGPFLHGRLIDLSYTAAARLGYVNQGSALVEVESIIPDAGLFATRPTATAARPPVPALPPVLPPAGPSALPISTEAGGHYLQMAAFTSLDNAENFLSVVEFQMSGSGYTRNENRYAARIQARDNRFRVEIGPYASREEAERAAADLESRFGVVSSAGNR
jgi:rare lipoprotein A